MDLDVTEKRVPHYSLDDIKAAFASPTGLNRTFSALEGAESLELDDLAVVAIIQRLAGTDFYKSMTSYANANIWQDVYRPMKDRTQLYVKFTLNAQNEFLLISFKRHDK